MPEKRENPDGHKPSRPWGRELRFALGFLLVFALLQYGYAALQGSTVEHLVIDVATVEPSAAAIGWLYPEIPVRAEGHRIVSPAGSLSVLNGCEGTESVFLLWAAIAAFPAAGWRRKAMGAAVGTALIYLLNQARIVALFYVLRQDRSLFDLLHGYIAPTVIILLGCLFFLGWAAGGTKRDHGPESPA